MVSIPHLNLDTILGIAVGIVGGFSYFRKANLSALTAQIGAFTVQVETLTKQVSDLDARCKTLEEQRNQARAEIVAHYTARIDIASENRELHQKLEKAQETIIEMQKLFNPPPRPWGIEKY